MLFLLTADMELLEYCLYQNKYIIKLITLTNLYDENRRYQFRYLLFYFTYLYTYLQAYASIVEIVNVVSSNTSKSAFTVSNDVNIVTLYSVAV